MGISNEYEPRFPDPKYWSPGVVEVMRKTEMKRISLKPYTFRVGELCYLLIGDIVNRRLEAETIHQGGRIVFNSPIEFPALANAVSEDWGGLTPVEQVRQLEQDAFWTADFENGTSLQRLMLYYPVSGEQTAVKLLARNIYSIPALQRFVDDRLMKADSVQQWKELYRDAVKTFGPQVAATLPHWIRWNNWETAMDHSISEQARATRILRTLFPDFDRYKTVFPGVADPHSQTSVVYSLRSFPSERIDEAVQRLFVRTLKNTSSWHDPDEDIPTHIDDLVMACADRMAGKGYGKEYLTYFERRMDEMSRAAEGSANRARFEPIQIWVRKLRSATLKP